MNAELDLLKKGQEKCADLLALYPSSVGLQSVAKQIEYLIGLKSGAQSDRSRLKDITIGVLTAREIEQLDADAAEVFYRIASLAKLM